MGSGRLNLRPNDGPAWATLHPGQYVVFLLNCNTDVLLDADGRPANDQTLVPVFDDLAEAEGYPTRAVQPTPSVCACIYDDQGRSGDPIRRIYSESVRRRFDPERQARWYLRVGGCFLCAFVIWAIIGQRSEEHFLWFYLLGLKLLTVGTVLFIRGLSFFFGRRRRGD